MSIVWKKNSALILNGAYKECIRLNRFIIVWKEVYNKKIIICRNYIKLITIIKRMSQMVAEKTKKIQRNAPGRQVRLWVRAKFLGFRRYL